jgi:branched-chain amino acid transport system ATP-binding protein
MTAALTLGLLCGGYGRLSVFRDVSLQIQQGSTLGILGPNGAGKTTLMKTVAGLLPPQSGQILFGSTDVAGLPAFRRARLGLALVPEGRQIIASLSVLENMELSLAATDLPEHAYRERLTATLDLFPRLRERQHVPGGALSGGEQQMLAIARALMLNPKVLMLDEPTQGLAPIMVKQVLDVLRMLKDQYTIIVVEQNRAFIDGLADSTLTMRGGKLSAS